MTEIRDDVLNGVKEIAYFIGFSERATRQLCIKREIPAYRLGCRWHLRRSTYERMIEKRERA